jgi:ElaB/YqjD/DUF883 family membrane-anchored ribosome-binding protein
LAKRAKPFSKPRGRLGPRQVMWGITCVRRRNAAQAASRQVEEQPLLAVIVGFALGYIAALLVHERR